MADLVRLHLSRTVSRAVFADVVVRLSSDSPPLSFVADDLATQDAWLQKQLAELEPDRTLLRIADLARGGRLRAVVTDTPDRLLEQALDRVGSTWQHVSFGEMPTSSAAIPLLRMWNGRIFEDLSDLRERENAAAVAHVRALLDEVDGVLIVGHPRLDSEVLAALRPSGDEAVHKPVVWIETVEAEGTSPAELLGREASLRVLRVDRLDEAVDSLCDRAGVPKTPVQAPGEGPEPRALISRVMNASFDVRPVLVLIPGVALLGGLLDRLPRINLKMALSAIALLATIIGWLNWRLWQSYDTQVAPMEAKLTEARALLAADDSLEGAIRAEGLLFEAVADVPRVTIPTARPYSFGALHALIDRRYAALAFDLTTEFEFEVIPRLYRHRLRATLDADPLARVFGGHAPFKVREFRPGDARLKRLYFSGTSLAERRLPRPLGDVLPRPRLAVSHPSSALLTVLIREFMLAELALGRIPVEIDLATAPAGPLDTAVFAQWRRVSGFSEGERAERFDPDGLTRLMNEGRGTFVFTHLGPAGAAANLARVQALLARFPKSRALIVVRTEFELRALRREADFSIVHVVKHRWSLALAHLRRHTSPDFVRAVLRNAYLRRRYTDPMVLAALVDTYRTTGEAPDGLGPVVHRLLQIALSRGKMGATAKLMALEALAWERRDGAPLSLERATVLVSEHVFWGRELGKAAALVAELIEAGTLRPHGGVELRFGAEQTRRYALAAYLERLPVEARSSVLLNGHDELVVFHASRLRSANAVFDAFVAPWFELDAALGQRELTTQWSNPYLERLRKAALLVENGRVSNDRVRRLEQALFRMASSHQSLTEAGDASWALSHFSTASIRRWVLEGIEGDSPIDHRLMRLAALAADDIYSAAIERWLRRLMTATDRRQGDRTEAKVKMASGESKGPRHATSDTISAVRNALSALAQIGTPAALDTLKEIASRDKDERFEPARWMAIRFFALDALLVGGHFDLLREYLPLVTAQPDVFRALLLPLAQLNDQPTVDALVAILGATKGDPKRLEDARRNAAGALAFMDPKLVLPRLKPLLQKDRVEAPYAALSLGVRGERPHVALVADLVDAMRADPKSLEAPGAGRAGSRAADGLAYVCSKEALDRYARLLDDEGWRKADRQLFARLSYFHLPEAVRLVGQRLLCRPETTDRQARSLLGVLGRQGMDESRELLAELLAIEAGRSPAGLHRRLCGDAPPPKEKPKWLNRSRVLDALAAVANPGDLPRFAAWAASPDESVRRSAYSALRRYPSAEAARALIDSATTYPKSAYYAIRPLERAAHPAVEPALLDLVAKPRVGGSAARALAEAGGPKALLALFARQTPKTTIGYRIRNAVRRIGKRAAGFLPPAAELIARLPPVPTPTPPAVEAHPAPSPKIEKLFK